jgi:hypothetical protein
MRNTQPRICADTDFKPGSGRTAVGKRFIILIGFASKMID